MDKLELTKNNIRKKNKLLTKFINARHPILKEETHTEYKNYRKLLSTLMKKVNRLFIINVLKQIGITLRTHVKESNL